MFQSIQFNYLILVLLALWCVIHRHKQHIYRLQSLSYCIIFSGQYSSHYTLGVKMNIIMICIHLIGPSQVVKIYVSLKYFHYHETHRFDIQSTNGYFIVVTNSVNIHSNGQNSLKQKSHNIFSFLIRNYELNLLRCNIWKTNKISLGVFYTKMQF